MCRILFRNTKEKTSIKPLLNTFSSKCKSSKRWQGDGWGICWREGNNWECHKSLTPIWESKEEIATIPESKTFLVHARGSSFPGHKEILNYNQPYGEKRSDFVFAFNGFIRGVHLPLKVAGEIGAQKIYNLLLQFVKTEPLHLAVNRIQNIITSCADFIEALNIVVCEKENVVVLCNHSGDYNYHSLHYSQNAESLLICSMDLAEHNLEKMENGEILEFKLYE